MDDVIYRTKKHINVSYISGYHFGKHIGLFYIT